MDQFPQVGQFFGVTHSNGTDGSYRDDVWECLASDEHRIVAKPIRPTRTGLCSTGRSGSSSGSRMRLLLRCKWP
jgi:hypothetical protein